jgi:hypothetical protein
LEHRQVSSLVSQEFGRDPRARPAFTDQHQRLFGIEIAESSLNFFQRDIHGSGHMARGKLPGGSHVHKLRRALLTLCAQLGYLDLSHRDSLLYWGRAITRQKGFRKFWGALLKQPASYRCGGENTKFKKFACIA